MSSHVEISHDLYKWLVSLQILPNTQKYKASGNFQLEFRVQQQLQCGHLIAKLLVNLANSAQISINEQLISSIKNSNTPAARVYNWNILTEVFFRVFRDFRRQEQWLEKKEGNKLQVVILGLLFYFYCKFKTKRILRYQFVDVQKLQKISNNSNNQSQGLDIRKVKKYQQISHSETVLEYILILISKCLSLTSKQAVATLAESSKYLAHMIVKGIKGSFQEIVDFVEESMRKMSEIMFLVEKDAQKNIQFLLQIFKPTLISRDAQVAKAGTELFKALVYESFKYNSKNIVYQVLCKEGEGFDFVYMGIKRHPDLNYQFFDFLYPLLRGILKDFFQIQFKRTINNQQQYINATVLLLEGLLKNKQAKQQVFNDGLLALWLKKYDSVMSSKVKGKEMIAINEETKNSYVQLMYTLWIGYYKQLEANKMEDILMKLTEELKKNTRNQIYTIRIPSLYKLFNILDFLATNRNKLAALLYKKIIFLFVENHNESELRQIILQNLIITVKKFPTIPLEFLLQPMLKQLTSSQGTSYILNMYDFQFIVELCVHPKMEQYYAIAFLDYFIKLYTKSIIFSSLIFRIIEAITGRFCESEQIREYCIKFTEQSLNTYGMLVMGKQRSNKAMYTRDKAQNNEEAIITNQKKSLIVELIKHFVSLQHAEMTNWIKQRVVDLFTDWYENKNHYDKGLAYILMEIGDIEEIVIQWKNQTKKSKEEKMAKQQLQREGQEEEDEEGINAISKVFSKNQSKGYSLEKSRLEYENARQSPSLNQIGLGYRKRKNKLDMLPRSKEIKPDPKVLQDIQKIKQKWKVDQSKLKLNEEEQKKEKLGKISKMNTKQLIQRHLSIGYSKLPDLAATEILFEFDSVKKMYLKNSLDLMDLDQEEERQEKSYFNVIDRYQKYLKNLYSRFANKSNKKQDNILSFTEIMRMLKEKNLLAKIPKIAINQIISSINSKRKKEKNVLGGIYEEDFTVFLLYYTDLLLIFDKSNKVDEPMGVKVEKVILRLLQGENNVRELFDPKIQKLKQDLEYVDDVPIPSDYKKIKQTQVQLDYRVRSKNNGVKMSFMECLQVLDGIVYEAVGIHIVCPYTLLVEKSTIVKSNKFVLGKKTSQSADKKLIKSESENLVRGDGMFEKNILADSGNSFTKGLKKNMGRNSEMKKKSESTKNMNVGQNTNLPKLNKNIVSQDQKKKRQLQIIHTKKLKDQVMKMREEKQKGQLEKKQKQKVQLEKKKKKQSLRQQYLDENKKKIETKKQEQQEKARQNEQAEKQRKNKKRVQMREKESETIDKHKKNLQQQREKVLQKQKQKQETKQKKDKLIKSQSPDKFFSQVKEELADQKAKQENIKKSIEGGEIKQIVDQNIKNIELLFQSYWNWQKQKMDLKSLAQLFKDFETIKYILPKDIADVYKNIAKGQLLSLQMFIECLVKLSYRSKAIGQQLKNSGVELDGILGEGFEFLVKLLKMKDSDYKQTIIKTKKQKQMK